MIEADILPAIRSRLASALAPPQENLRPLRVGTDVAGFLNDARAARLASFGHVFDVRDDGIVFAAALATQEARTEALHEVTVRLAADGLLTAWRNERYAVCRDFGGDPLFLLERAAARFFGVKTYAAHVNGLVLEPLALRAFPPAVGDTSMGQPGARRAGAGMWVARRSATKAIDPGMLDNLVGGGIAAGVSIDATVVKEAWEEAGVPAALAHQAVAAGAVHIFRAQPDGLHHETIFVHDLHLPFEFVPEGRDGEVVAHRLVSLADAASLIAHGEGPEVVTADASLVILDCLLRHGMIAPDAPDYLALEALRHPLLPGTAPR